MIHYEPSNGLCVLRLDAPPLNAITMGVLDDLRSSIRRAIEDEEIRGLIITGNNDHFSAGADVHLFREFDSGERAAELSRTFQDAFQEIEDSPKPVVAAVAGRVMGGALELAMACHWRVAAEGCRFSMPEINLGIVPGAGGTQRLPRLVGAAAALKMLLTAKPLNAHKALALGLIDAVCPGASLVARARELLQSGVDARPTGRRTDKLHAPEAHRTLLDDARRRAETTRPEIVAGRRLVEAVREGLEQSFEAGLRAERDAFVECVATPASRNKIHLFFASRSTGRVPDLDGIVASRPSRAAVVGMGTMGTGIVQALLGAGLPVVVCDQDEAALDRGRHRLRNSLEKRVSQARLSPRQRDEMLGRITTTTRWEDLGETDLVIESVFEDVEVKRRVFARLERVCSAETILATNTSTLTLDVLAERMRNPERLVGMHFFNPAQRMPLVEVIRRCETTPAVVAVVMQLARTLRKTPVLVRSREGFVVNRLFIPYLKEAFLLLEEGAEPEAVDAAMVRFGFPMGPLALIDMAGLDILVATDRVMSRAFADHGGLSPVALRLVEAGHLGQKTYAGVYQYAQGDYTPRYHAAAARIIADVRGERGGPTERPTEDEIAQRLVLRMVAEAYRVLDEEVARCPADVDVATVLGIGFPDFRGGVVSYAIELGLDAVRSQLDKLTERHGERFRPCRLLRKTKGDT